MDSPTRHAELASESGSGARPPPSLAQRIKTAPRGLLWGSLGGFAAYLLAMRLAQGENRPEQFLLVPVVVGLCVWSDGTRRLYTGLLPFLLFGIVYDLMHLTQPLVRYLHVHVEEPYFFDKRFFGIPTPEGVLTPNEFFQKHNWPIADFFTGISYIVFVWWAIGFAAYLAAFRRDPAGRRLLLRFGWTFLLMNVAGFVTYYVYPAAPPWYVADYGLGPANMDARSSVAGAGRFDALVGIPYFAGFYGRSADVFGAIPSLHVSYPLLTFLYGLELRKRWLDLASFGLFSLVCFAAVYLNHHYILDVLLGVAYTLAAWGAERALRAGRGPRSSAAGTPAR
jgi:membrane-associated phospholipid phosphatase